ncbi:MULTISPECIES: PepSY domain-containing protein [Bradyrhizobium]|uniref:PepSY domain-containing protein n=1 Tax=Bradyrhizobium TaxID=374 RepID=UPI0009B71BA3|nr:MULTISPECIES: PepSY domain-containing protein [Bradyrhizobium]
MWKRCLFAAILLVLTLPAYASAIASSTATPPASRNPAGDRAELDQQMINRELELFRGTQISLCQALLAAEQLHPGSSTWDIGLDGSSGSPVYRVKTVKVDRIWNVAIDARTGDVTGGEIVSLREDLNTKDRNSVIALTTVQQSLLDAVLIAERATQGKAIGGTIVREAERFNFVIVVVSGDDLKQVTLEPPRAHRREPHPRHSAVIQPCG